MAPIGMDDLQKEVVEREALGMNFSSIEAQYAYQRARRLHLVIRYVGGIILLAGFGYAMFLLGGGSLSRTAEGTHENEAGHSSSAVDIDPVGLPTAAVKVTAILPGGSDCHNEIVKFLTEIATARPENVRAEFKGMDSFTDKELSAQIGQVCAAVLINGNTEFDHMKDQKIDHHISLIGTVPTHYALGDLGLAINQVYAKEYGTTGIPPVDVSQYETSCKTDGCKDASVGHDNGDTQKCEVDGLSDTATDFSLPGFLDTQKK